MSPSAKKPDGELFASAEESRQMFAEANAQLKEISDHSDIIIYAFYFL